MVSGRGISLVSAWLWPWRCSVAPPRRRGLLNQMLERLPAEKQSSGIL
ncbi:hypothetical protein BMS3Bbin10_01953 [bacterium BMS3Bbin10]|nr:hypothetical protein BMS3Bbin10_01953 [bacterium BMS3Bbin10]